ncbi:sensor histidine kinase [Actinoallomurus soli]|uniref:sensor histidine kinase n=1 Tax=Actinoallomurus soli TaxID=2952535 RepID=UPI002092F793|nr:histidine kinase [Actinoallomurus soli]MCO5974107.1 histidine kinase [Actinoallomurus soli]
MLTTGVRFAVTAGRRSVWPHRRRDRFVTVLTAIVAVAGALFGLAVLPHPFAALAPAMLAGLATQLVATAVLAGSGSRPHVGMAAVVLVAASLVVVASPWRLLVAAQGVPWVPLALAWATVRVVERARAPWQYQLSAVLVCGYVVAVAAQAASGGGSPFTAALSAAVPVLGGVCVSLRGRLRRARRDRVAALVQERAAIAREARADERRRLAVEVHDALGHVLTLLVLHANALAGGTADARTRSAAERMSRLGADGLTELRRLLDLLTDPGAAAVAGHAVRAAHTPPQEPQLRTMLDALVEDARAAGQVVDLAWTGEDGEVPPVAARAVHRVVQEGLTNVRRHAPGAAADVAVAVTANAVDVTVRNGPAPVTPVTASPNTGRGLDGVRRRVTLLGGRCEHGPATGGGYTLRACLPLDGGPAAEGQDIT